ERPYELPAMAAGMATRLNLCFGFLPFAVSHSITHCSRKRTSLPLPVIPACFRIARHCSWPWIGGSLGSATVVSGSSSAVERQLPKLDVAGSIPVSRSIVTVPSIRNHPITSEQLKFQV